ncbi:MAG TPA: 50S ribosomal protein L29 [Bryobacteraceae bacterium]|nr:50S ribosomal protein L29 [Bryobacteraceae bacterium]
MKSDQIRAMDEKELASKAREIEDQIFRLRFQMSLGQMDALKKYRVLRKDRARLSTIQRERELKSAKGAN